MNTQHTPTPWKSDAPYNTSFIFGPDGEPIAQLWSKYEENFRNPKETEANAQRIVNCVNMHDQLVKKLAMMLDAYKNNLVVLADEQEKIEQLLKEAEQQ